MFSFQSHKPTLNKGGSYSINIVGKIFLRGKKRIPYLKNRQQGIMSNLRFRIGKTVTSLSQNKELKNGEKKIRTEGERKCPLLI